MQPEEVHACGARHLVHEVCPLKLANEPGAQGVQGVFCREFLPGGHITHSSGTVAASKPLRHTHGYTTPVARGTPSKT